jgi:quinol monooxygenase YgiN
VPGPLKPPLTRRGFLARMHFMNAPQYLGYALFVVKQNYLEEFKAAVAKVIEPTRREPGCRGYRAFQILDETGQPTNRFEFVEVWTTKEAMMVEHLERTPHMQEFLRALKLNTSESWVESAQIHGQSALEL